MSENARFGLGSFGLVRNGLVDGFEERRDRVRIAYVDSGSVSLVGHTIGEDSMLDRLPTTYLRGIVTNSYREVSRLVTYRLAGRWRWPGLLSRTPTWRTLRPSSTRRLGRWSPSAMDR